MQELFHHFCNSKSKYSNMLLKIDLGKTFDRLQWTFIHQNLTYFNFPTQLITLIMSCLATPTTLILINGTPTHYFTPTRGIKQGDPLSPYLFIMFVEMLSRNINMAVDYNQWKPVSQTKVPPYITLIFCRRHYISLKNY